MTEVDGVRGLAAASVVLYHSLLIFPAIANNTRGQGTSLLNLVKYSPLHAAFSGPQAVFVFFVISGFVLALPFFGPRRPLYSAFLVRRVARIWPAYAVACCVAFVAASAIGGEHIAALSSWFNGEWQQPLTASLVAQHLALIDQFDTGTFDPVLWSLVHEMRLSIIFPLLVLLVARGRPGILIVGTVLWTFVAFHFTPSTARNGDVVVTLQYLGCFVAGVLVARYRHPLVGRARSASARARMALAVVALLAYTYPWWMLDVSGAHSGAVDFSAVALGSTGWLLLALSSDRVGTFLRTAPLQYLGRISYSLYLIHAVVVLTLLHLFYGDVPTALILVAVWAVSLGLATVGERLVERPANAIGRTMALRIAPSAPTRS